MVHEIKETPAGTVYTKFSTSDQRITKETPLCANTFDSANGVMLCKGVIINNYCQKCGQYYGPGIDPRILARRKFEQEKRQAQQKA